jgi:hypothetical protein
MVTMKFNPVKMDENPDNRENGAEHVDPPAQEIEAWEGDVLGPDHLRQYEITQRCRYGRDNKQKYHHRAVQGENLVVGSGFH